MKLKIRAIEFSCFKCTSDRQLADIIFADKKIIYTYIIKQICNADVSFLSSGISEQYLGMIKIIKIGNFQKNRSEMSL